MRSAACTVILLLFLFAYPNSALATDIHNQKIAIISYEPPYIHDLVEGQKATFNITLSFSDRELPSELGEPTWNMEIESLHDKVAQTDRHTLKILPEDFEQLAGGGWQIKVNVVASGGHIGKTALKIALSATSENGSILKAYQLISQGNSSSVAGQQVGTAHYYDVWVIRDPSKRLLSDVFVGTLVILISIAMVLMGCELDLKVVWETVRRPVAPAIGFFSQAVLMPIVAYAIAQLLLVPSGEYSFALGLFATGCSPGGSASNFWTIMLDANAHLSVTMTFISTLTSLATMPLWMHFLGYRFFGGFTTDETLAVRVPFWKIARTLVLTLAPLLTGVLTAKYLPEQANHARKILRPFVVFLLVFLIVFRTPANLHMFNIVTWTAALAGFLLPLGGFAFGGITAVLACRKPEDIVTIAIETGVQHTGIAIMLLELSFPEPDSQIAMLLPVIVACSTPGPLLIGCGLHRLCRLFPKRRLQSTEADEKRSPGEEIELRLRGPKRSPPKKANSQSLTTQPATHRLPPPNELARLSEEDLAQQFY